MAMAVQTPGGLRVHQLCTVRDEHSHPGKVPAAMGSGIVALGSRSSADPLVSLPMRVPSVPWLFGVPGGGVGVPWEGKAALFILISFLPIFSIRGFVPASLFTGRSISTANLPCLQATRCASSHRAGAAPPYRSIGLGGLNVNPTMGKHQLRVNVTPLAPSSCPTDQSSGCSTDLLHHPLQRQPGGTHGCQDGGEAAGAAHGAGGCGFPSLRSYCCGGATEGEPRVDHGGWCPTSGDGAPCHPIPCWHSGGSPRVPVHGAVPPAQHTRGREATLAPQGAGGQAGTPRRGAVSPPRRGEQAAFPPAVRAGVRGKELDKA